MTSARLPLRNPFGQSGGLPAVELQLAVLHAHRAVDHRAMTAPATKNGKAPSGVAICEVVARDGFQSEPRFVPTANKVKFINELSQCGLAKIEVTSFTSPKAIPALADAADVVAQIDRVPGVVYSALVPNMLGAARALASKIDEINLVMSVSETHNLTNL